MGTNYYAHKNTCKCCGKPDEILHIGKSSGGWCFSLHIMPENNLNNLLDWAGMLFDAKTWKIFDEYDVELSLDDMLKIISERSCEKPYEHIPGSYNHYRSLEHFYESNQAEPGPNNLLRHKIGHHCVGHGEGTWDLIKGEFS